MESGVEDKACVSLNIGSIVYKLQEQPLDKEPSKSDNTPDLKHQLQHMARMVCVIKFPACHFSLSSNGLIHTCTCVAS